MSTVEEILVSLKIVRPTWTPLPTFRTLCPKCSALRNGKHRRKPCLRVVIAATRVTWRCSHCGWLGVAQVEKEEAKCA